MKIIYVFERDLETEVFDTEQDALTSADKYIAENDIEYVSCCRVWQLTVPNDFEMDIEIDFADYGGRIVKDYKQIKDAE